MKGAVSFLPLTCLLPLYNSLTRLKHCDNDLITYTLCTLIKKITSFLGFLDWSLCSSSLILRKRKGRFFLFFSCEGHTVVGPFPGTWVAKDMWEQQCRGLPLTPFAWIQRLRQNCNFACAWLTHVQHLLCKTRICACTPLLHEEMETFAETLNSYHMQSSDFHTSYNKARFTYDFPGCFAG